MHSPHRFADAVGSLVLMASVSLGGCYGPTPGSRTQPTVRERPRTAERPRVVKSHHGLRRIAAGSDFTCYLGLKGRAWCWGGNMGLPYAKGAKDHQRPVRFKSSRPLMAITAGFGFTCGLVTDGTVQCQGSTEAGTFGGYAKVGSPIAIKGLADVVDLDAGKHHACAVRANGSVWCWGSNRNYQLGTGTTTDSMVPVRVPGVNDAIQVAAGSRHTCVLDKRGRVSCWGDNDHAQTGMDVDNCNEGESVYTGCTTRKPTVVRKLKGALSISVGEAHSCAVLKGGMVHCWGRGKYNELGGVSTDNESAPQKVEKVSGAIAVATGDGFSCGLSKKGHVTCWGRRGFGVLGIKPPGADSRDTETSQTASGAIPSLSARQLTAGAHHACVITRGEQIRCWGRNHKGQLGNASTWSPRPVVVKGLQKASTVHAGFRGHSCAILQSGKIRCWGRNSEGELGSDKPIMCGGPVEPIEMPGLRALAIGAGRTCVTSKKGKVWCWGRYMATHAIVSEELRKEGTISVTVKSLKLTKGEMLAEVDFVKQAKHVSPGQGENACALHHNGTVSCWCWTRAQDLSALRDACQVDDDPQPCKPKRLWGLPVPLLIAGIRRATSVSVGTTTACALLRSGKVRCFGDNRRGLLGRGTSKAKPKPGPAVGLSGVTAVLVGSRHACALRKGGTVWCWGSNATGQLGLPKKHASLKGHGSWRHCPTPTQVPGIATVQQLAVGAAFTCARLKSGGVSCWGANRYGQLGDGATLNRWTPVQVKGLSDAVWISAGADHACAVKRDGTMVCWGRNDYGQLGHVPCEQYRPQRVQLPGSH